MSVIAFDGEVLAGDSRIMYGNRVDQHQMQKVFDSPDSGGLHRYVGGYGRIVAFGACGNLAGAVPFLRWIRDGLPEEAFPDACKKHSAECAYVVCVEDGSLLVFEESSHPVMVTKYKQAFGSGSDYAMGAMLAGASAGRAVQIASQLDPGCGGIVTVVKVINREGEDDADN